MSILEYRSCLKMEGTMKMKYSLGIIGGGFVGGAIARGFALTADVKIYDKDPKRSVNSFEDICNSEFIFLCLPTPMVHVEGGRADLTIVDSVCRELKSSGTEAILIIKSTVPIGTTNELRAKYELPIIHNPEFLTARNADIDFLTPSRTILGGNSELTCQVAELFRDRFPGNNILEMTSNESEAVKYVANCFFATKVIYFNEVFLGLKEAFELDWEKVMGGVLTDGRIGISHCDVPGHDKKLGYGGSCLPKDICALIHQLESVGFDPKLLKAAWEQNKIIRPEMDWGRIPSAVSGNEGT